MSDKRIPLTFNFNPNDILGYAVVEDNKLVVVFNQKLDKVQALAKFIETELLRSMTVSVEMGGRRVSDEEIKAARDKLAEGWVDDHTRSLVRRVDGTDGGDAGQVPMAV